MEKQIVDLFWEKVVPLQKQDDLGYWHVSISAIQDILKELASIESERINEAYKNGYSRGFNHLGM